MAGGRKQSGERRSDRLFELIGILRDGELHTARELATRLNVTERTIWRDMATLRASGVPVEGERGVGYRVTAPITLPPLNLSMGELEALHLAVAILGEATDPELARSASSLAAKIDAVLPENTAIPSGGWGFAVYPFADAASGFRHMPLLREAVRGKKILRAAYRSRDDQVSNRLIRPLQLDYWGRLWTCTAWCELRNDFRVFRVDRFQTLIDTGATFKDETGKTLDDYLAARA
ncbi:helix-turn-helix transcriptional regulator [Celeribacter sp.]|uniref:helix-turn-helix transcriptional regulator n=1 Tax=Celeribacter sp. TaxID=1890673 RepID=UPI003A956ACF